MHLLKRSFGCSAILVGLAGIIVSIVSTTTVWRSAKDVSQQSVEVLELALTAKNNADQYLRSADVVMGNMQQRVGMLKVYAESVSGDAANVGQSKPLIDQLDAELIRELGEARRILTSIQAGSDRLNEVVKQFDALSSSMRMFRQSGSEPDESDLKALSRSLTEVSELVQQVLDFVTRMQKQGVTPDQAMRMEQAVTRLQEVLSRESARLGSLQDTLQKFGDGVEAKRRQIPEWARTITYAVNVFAVCFIFTQLHLIWFGRSLISAPSASGRERAANDEPQP